MWFEFNGIHSNELNIRVLRFRKPVFPEFSDHYELIPGHDGGILFPQSFGMRSIEIDCLLLHDQDNRTEAIRQLSRILTKTEASLMISTEPDVYYIGKLAGTFVPDMHRTLSSFTLAFICQPFAYNVSKTSVSKQITASDKQITLVNNGTYDVLPIIKISNANTNSLSLTLDDDKLTISNTLQTNDVLTIDCDEMTVLLNDTNILDKTTGTFLTLRPGTNVMTIEAQNTLNVSVEWRERFL
ncbi:hypothetical protein [Geobacillus phage GBSV1]|uniref:Uncharacterized protein n=2 Tax=Svunavirus TaxID=2169625 RepID=A6XMK7_9CAUD|nr:distal tail protein Dit [Bacillus phage 1]YP_764486.1 distal tail protein Dit [Geobacillus phage GBSV1]ABC61286.1 hypothetical protein [Geobacillus phage GBSV1]ABJ09630.1 hypothetical protein [Bacillus phage 1]